MLKLWKRSRCSSGISKKPFLVLDELRELKTVYGFARDGVLEEDDREELSRYRFPTDINGRRVKDAEVLATIAANALPGDILEIGTLYGHSTGGLECFA